MAAAFINQVPASSYGFDFRYTHGWAFLYRTTSPPPPLARLGLERYSHLLCRKTPGSSEAGGLCSVVSNRTETPALDFARESPKATSLTKS